jgi:hypothetical protein
MAIAAVRFHARNERGLAHILERRSPQAGVSPSTTVASASTTSAAQIEDIKLPTSVKALTGMIVVFSLVILAIAFWKIRAWRRRRQDAISNLIHINEKQTGFGATETRIDLEAALVHTEKPSKALLLAPTPPDTSSGVGWVPQIKSNIAFPEPARPRSQHAKKAWEKNLAKFITPNVSDRSNSPPPSYISSANTTFPSVMPPIPPMPLSPPSQALPPTPPATLKLSFDAIVPPPTQKPVTTPVRPSSYGSNPIVAPSKSERKLPRLMNVSNAFDASMEDELSLSVGETVRLLEEYEDDWCLVQRVGRIDAEKGVAPRFCLSERLEVVPLHPGLPSTGTYRL